MNDEKPQVSMEEIDEKLQEIRANPDSSKNTSLLDRFRKKEMEEPTINKNEIQKQRTPEEIEARMDPEDLPEIIELRDANQILEMITGQTVSDMAAELVYDFVNSQGHRSIGLSFMGVRSAIHTMGQIHITNIVEVETEDYVRIRVEARDLKRNLDVIGVYQQDKNLQLRSGAISPQRFYWVLAYNKALRNAWHHLIPTSIVKRLIEEYKKTDVFAQRTREQQARR